MAFLGLALKSYAESLLVSSSSRYYCTVQTVDLLKELEAEVVQPIEDLSLVKQYQALSPSERAVYDERKVLNREMSHFRKQGQYASAVEVYKKMMSKSIPPDHYTFSQTLNLYALLKRPSSAESVWQKMLVLVEESRNDANWNISKTPRTVTLPTINAMIHVYAQSSDLPKAMALYEDISSKFELSPDEASLLPVLWLLSVRGEVSHVERLYFDWKQSHPDWVGSLRIYTILIRMYGKAGQYHNISKLFDEMREKEVKLDPLSIQVILKTLIASDEQITSDLILRLQELSALNTAFPVIAKDLNTMNEALTLLASMKASEVAPDVSIFNTLITRVCKDYTEARHFVKLMEEDYELKPNGATYDAMLMMAATPAEKSKITDVNELVQEIAQRGILPSESTYCILIRFYSQVGDKRKAEELLEMLKSHNPNISTKTHNAVIRMYSFGGPYHKLMEALKEVQEKKVKLDTSTVDIMYQSMMRKHRFLDCANMIIHMIHNRERVQMRHIVTLYEHCLERAGLYNTHQAHDDIVAAAIATSASDTTDFGGQEAGKKASPFPVSSSAAATSSHASRSPGHVMGDVQTVLQLHQVMVDTPGALTKAPVEYFVLTLKATAHVSPAPAMCKVVMQALKSHLSPEDHTIVFVEFLKLLEKNTFQFADDIAAWKGKLTGEGRTNPLIQSQYSAFLKYVQSASKSPVTGSRVNRPTL